MGLFGRRKNTSQPPRQHQSAALHDAQLPKYSFSDLLTRAQALAPLAAPEESEFGARIIPMKELGKVFVKRMYEFAALHFESAYDFASAVRGPEALKYALEFYPHEVRLFRFGETTERIEISPHVLRHIDFLITELSRTAAQQDKIIDKGFRELLSIPTLTKAQCVAWGLAHATKRIDRIADLLNYERNSGPQQENIDRAVRLLQRIIPDLEAMREYLDQAVPSLLSPADFENSVAELHGTCADLLNPHHHLRRSVTRAFQRVARAKKIIDAQQAATAHLQGEPIAA